MMHIAIDPGQTGGIAWSVSGEVRAGGMPDSLTGQVQILTDLARGLVQEAGKVQCCIERVGGYVPGNAGPAAVTFARHCGNIEAIVATLRIPMVPPLGVTPQTWMASMSMPRHDPIDKAMPMAERKKLLAQRKAERKRAIRDLMQRQYPHLKVTLETADALGILTWAMKVVA